MGQVKPYLPFDIAPAYVALLWYHIYTVRHVLFHSGGMRDIVLGDLIKVYHNDLPVSLLLSSLHNICTGKHWQFLMDGSILFLTGI